MLFNMKLNNKQGFTAIELIVTIAIISILAAALVPTLSRSLPSVQLNGEIRTLTGDIREVQEKAITEQKQHLIRFFPTAAPPYYELIRLDEGNEELIKKRDLSSGHSLNIEPTIAADQIVFSPDGGPSSNGNITISVDAISKNVNVSPAGFVKIE